MDAVADAGAAEVGGCDCCPRMALLAATIGGALQVLLLFFLGFCTALFLRYDILPSIYVGIILAFSSTMVVIKILGDRNELDTLHGRIVISFLLMQDLFAIILELIKYFKTVLYA